MPEVINTPVTLTLSDASTILAAWDGTRCAIDGYPENCPLVTLPANTNTTHLTIVHAEVQGVVGDFTAGSLILMPGVARRIVLPFGVALSIVALPPEPAPAPENPEPEPALPEPAP